MIFGSWNIHILRTGWTVKSDGFDLAASPESDKFKSYKGNLPEIMMFLSWNIHILRTGWTAKSDDFDLAVSPESDRLERNLPEL